MAGYIDFAMRKIAQDRADDEARLMAAQAQSVRKPSIGDYLKGVGGVVGGQVLAKKLADMFMGAENAGTAGAPSVNASAGSILDPIKNTLSSVFPGQGKDAVSSGFLQETAPGSLLDTGDIIAADAAVPEGANVVGSAPVEGLSGLGQALSAAAIAHGGYGLAKNWGEGDWKQGAMSGAEMAAGLYPFLGPWSLAAIPIGAGLGAIHTGRTNEGTIGRNSIREFLASRGVSPEAGYLNLPTGERFQMTSGGGGSGNYNVDQANPLSGQAVGFANPLGEIISSGDDKFAGQTAGWYSNAALQGAANEQDVLNNIRYQYRQAGITKDEAYRAMRRLQMAGKITQQEKDAYEAALNQIFSG